MNKGAVIAGIIGLGAVGLGAYALTRNSKSTSQQSNTDSAFNGFTGGGSTGNSGNALAETLGTALGAAFQTPSSQVEPYSEIIPEMQAQRNPSDEVSDVNQVLGNLRTLNALPGFDPSKTELYLSGVQKDQNTSASTTAAEYNQGNSFAPAPKQADMSSYNEEKTGGSTEITSKQTSEKTSGARISSIEEGHAALAATSGPVDAAIKGISGLFPWW